ncbi:MAG TPA: hypothetical protein ENN17_13175 [bacterium]|nr:hypothetical protein [bacterium]
MAQTAQPPLLRQIGEEMVSGILKANYREMPIDEILPVQELPLPDVRIPFGGPHPRLLFPPARAEEIRLRRWRAPYREWADRILETAAAGPDPASPLLNELRRSQAAKVNAFAWFLTSEPVFLETAVRALIRIPELGPVYNLEGGRMGVGWGDFMEAAEAVRHYAVAYDLVHSVLSPGDREQIVRRLAGQTEKLLLYRFVVPKNNHAVAIGAGIGTAALALDHPRAQVWLDAALGEIRAGLAQIEPDGSYREGGYYARYIASRLYPFALYLYSAAGVNLLSHPRIRLFDRWLADIEKPDGSVPDFDDAFPEALLYQPIAAGLAPESGEVRRLFLRHPGRSPKDDPNWIEAFCAYTERPLLSVPDDRSAVFYPHGGMAVFRDDPEIFGFFLGEPGRPHLSGHDHVEPGAFTLHAFGKNLLLDAGYGPLGVEDPNRAWYASAQAHNMVLVDGLGPDQNPVRGDPLGGTMRDYFAAPSIAAASVHARYRGAVIHRRVWFAGRRIFVVSDRMESGSPRHFAVPWHGAGAFEDLGQNRVRWTRDEVGLGAHFIRPDEAPLFIEARTGLHTRPDPAREHTLAHVALPPSESQRLLTLFAPQRAPDRSVSVAGMPVFSDVSATARLVRFSDSPMEILVVSAEGNWACGVLESDARTAVYQRAGFPEPDVVTLEEATRLRIAGKDIFSSTLPVTLSLVFDPAGWVGHLSASDGVETRVAFQVRSDPGVIGFDRASVPYRRENGWVLFTVRNGGIFEMGPQSGRVRRTETVRENLPVLERVSRSADPEPGRNLTQTERVRLRNEIVRALGQAGMEAFDARSGPGIGAGGLFGIASGLLNSLFAQTGGPGLNLPQQFDFERRVAGHRVRYFEEGTLTQGGLRVHRHQLFVDETLWLTRETPFTDYSSTEAMIFKDDFQGQFHLRKHGRDLGWGGLLRRDLADGWVSAGHQSDLAGSGETSRFGMGRGPWDGNLSLRYSPASWNGADFTGRHRDGGQATTVRFRTDRSGTDAFGMSHARRLSPSWHWSGTWESERHPAASGWRASAASLAWFGYGPANGFIRIDARDGRDVRSAWQGQYRTGRWLFDSRGLLTPLCTGDLGAAWRSPVLSVRSRLLRGKRMEADWIVRPAPGWSSTFRAGWTLRPGAADEAGVGLWHHGKAQAGGEVRFLRRDGEWLAGLTGTASAFLSGSERIHGYASVLFAPDGRRERVEILVRQSGRLSTPGVFLVADRRGVTRLEGFLMWRF